ncbi:hypothetical protein BH11PSE11_BH11PSE11_05100 [soil metagenome]
MNKKLNYVLGVAALALAAQASAQIRFYEGEGFSGRSLSTDKQIWNLDRSGFNDRISSIVVERGRWEVCQDARFEGRCVVLRRGSYDSLRDMGMNNRISSVRPADESRRYRNEIAVPVVVPAPVYESRRRDSPTIVIQTPSAPVYESRRHDGPPQVVISAPPAPIVEQRRREAPPQVVVTTQAPAPVVEQRRREATPPVVVVTPAPAPVVEQRRREAPPVVVAPAPAPAAAPIVVETRRRVAEPLFPAELRSVQAVPGRANLWEVSYSFRGVEHLIRTSTPPGPTVMVNESGEFRQ